MSEFINGWEIYPCGSDWYLENEIKGIPNLHEFVSREEAIKYAKENEAGNSKAIKLIN